MQTGPQLTTGRQWRCVRAILSLSPTSLFSQNDAHTIRYAADFPEK